MALEMKTVEVKIPKNAVSVKIIGFMKTTDGLGLEWFEISRDDLCKPVGGAEE